MMKKIMTAMLLLCSCCIMAQEITNTWKGTLKVGAQTLTIVLHVDQARQSTTMDVVEQGAEGMAMKVNLLTDDSLSVTMEQLGISYTGRLNDGKLVGRFQQLTFVAPLNMEVGTVRFRRPQEPQPPYPYDTCAVTFRNAAAEITLAGTLTYPVGYKQGDRVPVVLMVTGSGPQNRDEEMMHHKPFRVIADRLARHGIASLRYDDRGTAQSEGRFDTATTLDFAADARCGLDYLKSTNRFSQVGILGHSEGGAIAYMLGSEGMPDFVVSLAGPACRIDTMMVVQFNALAKVQGAAADVVHDVAGARRLLLQTQDTPWMRCFLDLDMEPFVRKTACPVLAIGGETDLNVPSSLNTPALEKHLADNPRSTIKVYAGLSHALQHNPSGNPLEMANIEETMAEEVLADIAEWINKL